MAEVNDVEARLRKLEESLEAAWEVNKLLHGLVNDHTNLAEIFERRLRKLEGRDAKAIS